MRQQQQIRMGAYYYNGQYVPFEDYPASFDVWNINYRAEKEFVEQPSTRALSGRERGNIGGYRIVIDMILDNSFGSNNTNLRNLLSLVPSQYVRTAYKASVGSGSTSNLVNVSLDVPKTLTNNALTGTFLTNPARTPNKALVTAYVGTTSVATVDRNVSNWQTSDNINVSLLQNLNTVIGVSTDNTNGNIIYCNLVGGSYGIARELTVGKQTINLQLRSVERFATVPSNLEITLV